MKNPRLHGNFVTKLNDLSVHKIPTYLTLASPRAILKRKQKIDTTKTI